MNFLDPIPTRWRERFILPSESILNALKLMDNISKKLLLVTDGFKFVGLLSIGDIQRAIIQNHSMSTRIADILRNSMTYASVDFSYDEIKSLMLEYRMELCPVVNGDGVVVDIYFWEDVFLHTQMQPKSSFNLPVVIMAGGLGLRLRPLTQVLPKPLIPIGERSIIEEIIDSFVNYGCEKFHISLNYKSDLIKFYLNSINLPIKINYYIENEPLGTGGSLSLMKSSINSTFFITNCDILISQDYSEVLDYHRNTSNEITLVSAIRQIPISYGTLETDTEGRLTSIVEKPDITFKINTGLYLFEPHLLDEIPNKKYFPITNLIQKLVSEKRRVGVFPVSDRSWTDIGEPELLKNYLASKGY